MSRSSESWRLFIAIELPKDVRGRISRHIQRLREQLPEVRASWTREENLHLTLKFLGDNAVATAESVSEALKLAAGRFSSFEIEIRECGAFPPRGKPNVLWIGISDPSANLAKLHEEIEDECDRIGITRERRTFHPHLTIARLRDPRGTRELAQLHQDIGFDPVGIRVTDLCLIRSELSSAGSRYTVIARHSLV